MAGNSIGTLFKLTTFGESHGEAIGGVIDGCPSGIEISIEQIQNELDRRRPGQSNLTTQRKEGDKVQILSGVFEGKTTGTPIGFIIQNQDAKSKDYSQIKDVFRPSHADKVYNDKYGFRDYRGGGRSSARETATRVVGGAIARQALSHLNVDVWAYVSAVGEVEVSNHYTNLDCQKIESSLVRCPDAVTAQKMIERIEQVKKAGDSIGGIITCVIRNAPVGLGEPVFDKLHADLGKAMLSINAVKGFEIGSGFSSSRMLGSEHNDLFNKDGSTKTNNSGGIQGGISNGEDIVMRIAFKPVATIMKDQPSINAYGEEKVLLAKGRHDPCVVPRAVPIVEAMALLTILDHYLRNKTSRIV